MKKAKGFWTLLLLGISILYFLFLILNTVIRDYSLNHNSKIIKGIVIDERNYLRNDKIEKSYTYSYEFIIDNRKYRKNSTQKGLRVGDSVLIEYYPKFPTFNRILKQNRK